MKFCIEHISKASGRLGNLKVGEAQFKTPLLLQTTKSGSIPHLSREVFDYVSKDKHTLQLSLATMLRMADSIAQYKGEGGVGSYIGFKSFPTLLVMHDPCETLQCGHNDKDVVPIFTRHGKEQLTAQRFMDLIENIAPDFYEGICDTDTNLSSSKKRVQKSFDRTETFMNYCLERHRSSEKLKSSQIFAPIVGGYSTFTRTKSIQHINKVGGPDVGGYLIEGLHSYGFSAMDVDKTELYAIVEHCVKELNCDKPRMMAGAYTPVVTLELISLGVDIFDTSYPYCATKSFQALLFNYDVSRELSDKSVAAFLDLTDEKYKEDFKPFMDDCVCLACRKHTRAYVHHLYKTKELLGPILLMIHNLHHYMEFFKAIHTCIEKNILDDLIKLIKFQHTENEIDYRVPENTNSDLLQQNKKGNSMKIAK